MNPAFLPPLPSAASNRRQCLRSSGLRVLALSLPQYLGRRSLAAARPEAKAGRAKACIVLYCWGGSSHLDTWAPHPNAPVEVRGEFKPIATAVPGIQVGEHMPMLAQQTHRLAVV